MEDPAGIHINDEGRAIRVCCPRDEGDHGKRSDAKSVAKCHATTPYSTWQWLREIPVAVKRSLLLAPAEFIA
jgi:hypothetical protein